MRPPGWLLAPWLLLALLAAGISALWIAGRGEAERALDAAPAQAAKAGVRLALGPRNVSGFPFRLRVRISPVRVQAPSGWAVQAPELVAQAYVWAPRRWVLVAPQGVTLSSPQGDGSTLTGDAVRASVTNLGRPDWLAVAQADGARVLPRPGVRPTWLQSARRLVVDAKAGPRPGDTALLLTVERGVATPESAPWLAASGAPFDLAASGRAAAGAFTLERLAVQAGPLALSSSGAVLRLDAAGRLEGEVPLVVAPTPGAAPPPGTPAAVALTRGGTLLLALHDGQARLLRPKRTR